MNILVRAIQTILSDLHLLHKPVDGVWDPHTQATFDSHMAKEHKFLTGGLQPQNINSLPTAFADKVNEVLGNMPAKAPEQKELVVSSNSYESFGFGTPAEEAHPVIQQQQVQHTVQEPEAVQVKDQEAVVQDEEKTTASVIPASDKIESVVTSSDPTKQTSNEVQDATTPSTEEPQTLNQQQQAETK
jgi:hypothetical protein